MSFLCFCLEMCYLERNFAGQFADFTSRIYIASGDTGTFYIDNISGKDVKSFFFKQTYNLILVSLLFPSETMDIFCLAGSAQQAQKSTLLAEGLIRQMDCDFLAGKDQPQTNQPNSQAEN